MKGNSYKFRFYINSRHFVSFGNETGKLHPHTWEIVIQIRKDSSSVIAFTEIEKRITQCLSKYNGIVFNKIQPFDELTPTMENIGVFLCVEIAKVMEGSDFTLEHFEISENPCRSFVINDCQYTSDMGKYYMTEQNTIGASFLQATAKMAHNENFAESPKIRNHLSSYKQKKQKLIFYSKALFFSAAFLSTVVILVYLYLV